VFGTSLGFFEKYGPNRVIEFPAAENGTTGIAIGMAISGARPIIIHHRVDFAILSMDALVNQAAKMHYMYGGKLKASIVVRLIIGRGWGQGPQHSQSLQAWFAHIPGLKVYMPILASDAYQMLIHATLDDAPVVILEHRWLYDLEEEVQELATPKLLQLTRVAISGADITLVGFSYMGIENRRAAKILEKIGIRAEVIDVLSLQPLDLTEIIASITKTKRLIISDTGQIEYGASAELLSRITESGFSDFIEPPARIGLPFSPTPTAPDLSAVFYPRAIHIARKAAQLCGENPSNLEDIDEGEHLDIPSKLFKGPY
jgi:pyruvate dehydrogenase E1 component beta subunit